MNRDQTLLRIRLGQSKRLTIYQHLLHALLLTYSTVTAVSYPLEMLLPIGWLTISWFLLLHRTRIQAQAQTILIWRADGSWLVEEASGQPQHHRALASCFTSHRLTILGFRTGGLLRRYYLLLTDNCDPEQHRQLRVRLRQKVTQQDRGVGSCSVSGQ